MLLFIKVLGKWLDVKLLLIDHICKENGSIFASLLWADMNSWAAGRRSCTPVFVTSYKINMGFLLIFNLEKNSRRTKGKSD